MIRAMLVMHVPQRENVDTAQGINWLTTEQIMTHDLTCMPCPHLVETTTHWDTLGHYVCPVQCWQAQFEHEIFDGVNQITNSTQTSLGFPR